MPIFSLHFVKIRLIAALAWLLIATGAMAAPSSPSFAFYYGRDIPWEALGAFDVAVVEPGNVGPAGWRHRLNPNTTVAAYIAVGEVHPTRAYFKQMQPQWKLGSNPAWGSIVVDQAAPGWSAFYLQEVVKPLWNQGFRAFFLDTLDSFYLVAKTPEARQKQIAGMANLVREIKRAYPDAKLIFNRGFEILPEVNTLAYAVAAESLFQGWDAGEKKYKEVPAADRDWILAQLRKCQTEYKLHAIAIDYVAPADRALARRTAQRIKGLGLIPWVTNPAIDMLGVGQVEVLPRQILALHDEPGHLADVALHAVHRLGALPLNYLGLDMRYVFHTSAELEDVANRPLVGRFAGVVTWFTRGDLQMNPALSTVLDAAREQGVPLVMLGDLPGASTLDALGVKETDSVRLNNPLRIGKKSQYVGFEIEPLATLDSFTPLSVQTKPADVWLQLSSEAGASADVIAITSWGGLAADRHFMVDLPGDAGSRWVVNPIEFFKAALKIRGDLPVPDVSTETGRRLLLAQVDGDGFPSRAEIPGTPLASEVMLKEFLERYRLPIAVSVIEGEVAPGGLYSALSPLMEKTARQIFNLPHVEIASHTYSHPFYWADAELGTQTAGRAVSLTLPNYRYDANREISGSRDYVDKLAPKGKKTRLLLWSGNTEPLATPVRLAYEAGMLNMNGGFTTASQSEPTLTLIAPLGMMKGDYFQVYAPMQNENVYTNLWTGPFYGFERVIETFKRTESPLRIKPVNIYYHTYIATKRASIASLHKVYGWAEQELQQQRLHPIFATEYIERVLDWRRATVAQTDTGLELRGGQHLRQWRVDAAALRPFVGSTQGIAGFKVHEASLFVHASEPVAQWTVQLAAQPAFYVESANAKLVAWESKAGMQQLRFDGHLPLHARVFAPRCELQASSGLKSTRRGDWLDIESPSVGKTSLVLRCTE